MHNFHCQAWFHKNLKMLNHSFWFTSCLSNHLWAESSRWYEAGKDSTVCADCHHSDEMLMSQNDEEAPPNCDLIGAVEDDVTRVGMDEDAPPFMFRPVKEDEVGSSKSIVLLLGLFIYKFFWRVTLGVFHGGVCSLFITQMMSTTKMLPLICLLTDNLAYHFYNKHIKTLFEQTFDEL